MTIKDLKDKNLILFESISGSKAFGLATDKSDTDIKGVFYMSKDMYYGLNYIPQVSNETNDEVYYEIGRFIELLLKNNPNIIEILATPDDCILFKHPIMDKITIDMVLSKLCKETFAGYALTQIKKARGLNKKILNPLPKQRKTILDFCYITDGYSSVKANLWLKKQRLKAENCGLSKIPNVKNLYALFYDENSVFGYKGIAKTALANEVPLSSIPSGEKQMAYLFFNMEAYSTYCKEYSEYWEWVANRNENRYELNKSHGKSYDAKNMMHTIRLLQVALEIFKEGKVNVKRSNRDELLAIRNGVLEYEEIITLTENLMNELEKEYKKSLLPDTPDKQNIEDTLIGIRKELYK